MAGTQDRIKAAVDRSVEKYNVSNLMACTAIEGVQALLTSLSAIPYEIQYQEGALNATYESCRFLITDQTKKTLEYTYESSLVEDRFYLFFRTTSDIPDLFKVDRLRPFEKLNTWSGWVINAKKVNYNEVFPE